MEFWFFIFFVVIGTLSIIKGQSIITPPNDATEIIGARITFQCELKPEDNLMMAWDHNDEAIYSYYANKEKLYKSHEKYIVGNDGRNFVLTVKDLKHSDGGIYACRTITSIAEANLIILDTPILTIHAPSLDAGEQALFVCLAHYGGPPKNKISQEHIPQLLMYLDGIPMQGTVKEQKPEHNAGYHILQQDYYAILEPSMNGKIVECAIETFIPRKAVVASMKVEVPLSWKVEVSETKQKAEGNPLFAPLLVTGVLLVIACVGAVMCYLKLHHK